MFAYLSVRETRLLLIIQKIQFSESEKTLVGDTGGEKLPLLIRDH